MNIMIGQGGQRSGLRKELVRHFGGLEPNEIVTASRQFQPISRVDLQAALEEFFAKIPGTRLIGMAVMHYHETIPLAHLHSDPNHGVGVAPLQHDDVDVGDVTPVRCLKNGLWMAKVDGIPVAVLLSPLIKHGMTMGVYLEIATPEQFHLESGNGDGVLNEEAVKGAFEEMVFAGGALNLRLLGGEAVFG